MSAPDGLALPGELGPITVPIARFRDRVPDDAWPPLPEGGVLWRRDVFAVADAWRNGTCSSRQLTAVTLMWGFGRTAYGPYRTGVVLSGDPDGARLDIGLEPLRAAHLSENDLRAIYVSFCNRQAADVRGLGPAFFTKLLYFAGYRRGTGGVQPLILDKIVAQRLPDEAGPVGPARRKTWGWRSTEWLKYLQWAAVQSQSPEYGGEPEGVEMRLFADGMRNRRTRA